MKRKSNIVPIRRGPDPDCRTCNGTGAIVTHWKQDGLIPCPGCRTIDFEAFNYQARQTTDPTRKGTRERCCDRCAWGGAAPSRFTCALFHCSVQPDEVCDRFTIIP